MSLEALLTLRIQRVQMDVLPRVWRLDITPFTDIESARSWLSPDEVRRANQYQRSDLRDHFTLRRCLARLALGQELGIAPADVSLRQGPNGQPRSDHGFVSLSHSGDVGLVALHDRQVGVDIEAVVRFDFQPLLDDQFLTHEAEEIIRSPDPLVEFYRAWTLKESRAKLVGEGLSRSVAGPSDEDRHEPDDPKILSRTEILQGHWMMAISWESD